MKDYSPVKYTWSKEDPPFQARALIKAGKILYAAGYPDLVDEEKSFGHYQDKEVRAKLENQKLALQGEKGGILRAMSADNGKKLSELKLTSPPVFDGMAAAYEKLYISSVSGSVAAFGK